MHNQWCSDILVVGMMAAIGFFMPAQAALAQATVEPGWDLFETTDPTTFVSVPWEGVPLGTFDFGGVIGIQDTGTTDTIVERRFSRTEWRRW